MTKPWIQLARRVGAEVAEAAVRRSQVHGELLTQSIIVLVNMTNQKLRVPLFSSPVDSAQPTLPAGYSPPMPIPTYASRLVSNSSDVLQKLRYQRHVTYEEAPGGQDVEHADSIAMVV